MLGILNFLVFFCSSFSPFLSFLPFFASLLGLLFPLSFSALPARINIKVLYLVPEKLFAEIMVAKDTIAESI